MSLSPKAGGSRLVAILGINLQVLFAAALGCGAYLIWPDDPYWWGLGVVSILSGMASLACLANALRAMKTLHARDKALAEYMAQGGRPKTARLASDESMRRAGMVE